MNEIGRQSEAPLYNIGAVVQMTSVPAATLRAWERRYGFPEAGRSAGGQRLYSDAEVVRLRWVKNRVDEGMQPSQAVRALRATEERNGFASLGPEEETTGIAGPVSISSIQDQLIDALTELDLERADRVLQEAVAAVDPDTLFLSVVAPVMAEIGARWEAGDIDVATEHLSTNFLRQGLLMWMLTSAAPLAAPPVIMACAPGEMHEGGLLILAALLRRRRIPVAYLGQLTPVSELATLVTELRPSLVVVGAARAETAAELADWPSLMPDAFASGSPIVSYGGNVFVSDPQWRQRVPGVYLGDTLEEGLAAIERLLPTLTG